MTMTTWPSSYFMSLDTWRTNRGGGISLLCDTTRHCSLPVATQQQYPGNNNDNIDRSADLRPRYYVLGCWLSPLTPTHTTHENKGVEECANPLSIDPAIMNDKLIGSAKLQPRNSCIEWISVWFVTFEPEISWFLSVAPHPRCPYDNTMILISNNNISLDRSADLPPKNWMIDCR